MSLPNLPVPGLDHTLDLLHGSVAALGAGSPEFSRLLADFRADDGPVLQQRLERFAARRAADGRSWLADEWVKGYFSARGPLTLTSNVGFAVNLPQAQFENEHAAAYPTRLARAVHAIATVHLAEVRHEIEPTTDGRGAPLDMAQFRVLAGGLRHPQPDVDTFRTPTQAAARREIGILADGRMFALRVADEDGSPLPPGTIALGLGRILDAVRRPAQEHQAPQAPGGFAGMSYLGSAELAPLLAEMCARPDNAATYDRLTDFMCTVTLTTDGAGYGYASGDDAPLARALTETGGAWVYKPMSYRLDLRGGQPFVHVEHSMFDGGVLAETLGLIQKLDQVAVDESPTCSQDGSAAVELEELRWALSPEARDHVARGLADYEQEAGRLRVRRLHLPRVPDADLPHKMSLDALHQITLATAQVLAFGRVRSAYESVDMRTYAGGRTECLRPVTAQSVTLARALAGGTATADQLHDMLEAHRAWVKACKSGAGFDRHLVGLGLMVDDQADSGQTDNGRGDQSASPAHRLLHGAELTAVQTDFLSTTSLGGPEQVVRYSFAPTTADGFGVCYSSYPDALDFTVSYVDGRTEEPEKFLDALTQAAGLLKDFISSLPARAS